MMPLTIKYNGSERGWDELATTGKPSVWNPGQQEERSDSEAALLIATGLFSRVFTDSLEEISAEALKLTDAGLTLAGNSLTPSQAAQVRDGAGLSYFSATAGVESLASWVARKYDAPNPHNQTAMPSPPTITVTDTTRPAGLTLEYKVSDGTVDPVATFTGGWPVYYGSGNAYRRFPVVTAWKSAAGNVGSGRDSVAWRAGFLVNAQKVSINITDSSLKFRFIVGDRYTDLAGHSAANTFGDCHFQLDFGSKAEREIWVEGALDTGFKLIGVAPGDTVKKLGRVKKRGLFLGDSFTQASGATLQGDGLALVCGDMLGIQDVHQSGCGGTGYVNTVGGTKYKLSERLLTDAVDTGPWDMIKVSMGINDLAASGAEITAEAASVFSTLRAANPSTPIFVVGPWDQAAPSAPLTGYATVKAAIMAAIPQTPGFFWIDPEGVAFTKDGTNHPDTAGHDTLGKWLALQIKTLIGA
jgi:lysophospholipase L1-like esterase